MTTARNIQELAASYNRMFAPVQAVVASVATPDANVIPDCPGLAESAEVAEWRADVAPAPVRAAELLGELLEAQRVEAARNARRARIILLIAAASLAVSIVVAVFK